MKKRIILASVVLTVILGSIAALAIFHHTHAKNADKTANKQAEDTLEEFDDGSLNPITFDIQDDTESYSPEELDALKAEVQSVIDAYYGKMFEFNSDTKDYSADLKGFYGTSDVFENNNSNLCENIYQEFKGVNMESTFSDYHIYTILIRKDKILPEVSVMGTVQASFKNDMLKQGDYSVLTKMVLIKEDGKWKIFTSDISAVYKENAVTVYFPEAYNKETVNFKGKVLMSWDITDVDGFLTGYDYGLEWSEEEYVE